ncbi:hypothetical protein XNC1_2554 [Xenorhabdus nematophila ATCC 19061]|uniref:Uncharacterized protein n=1 Tax=Xenorhabdus nematophila (strain ATCC 19061 / DSM 3370 / CCUG 14189 / LMG 1036 / NCIMB 9965 / AN6) TaxID=406817 RepID=D3VHG7_XENNA|nr:hypothetical protein XNC1_2554 [Xenorhabdus nematophila ATCC 19061]
MDWHSFHQNRVPVPTRITLRLIASNANTRQNRDDMTENIYGLSRFCNTHFDEWLACLNLSGVSMSMGTRATMSSAPDEP